MTKPPTKSKPVRPTPLDRVIMIRVSEEDFEAFEKLAQTTDRKVADWCRHVCRKAAGRA